jgi:hypothetical protein
VINAEFEHQPRARRARQRQLERSAVAASHGRHRRSEAPQIAPGIDFRLGASLVAQRLENPRASFLVAAVLLEHAEKETVVGIGGIDIDRPSHAGDGAVDVAEIDQLAVQVEQGFDERRRESLACATPRPRRPCAIGERDAPAVVSVRVSARADGRLEMVNRPRRLEAFQTQRAKVVVNGRVVRASASACS